MRESSDMWEEFHKSTRRVKLGKYEGFTYSPKSKDMDDDDNESGDKELVGA